MSNKMHKLKVPRTKWCLFFDETIHLESKFQENTRKTAYEEIKKCHITLMSILTLIMIINLSLHLKKGIMNYSNSTSIGDRAIFWMVTRHPILWVLLLLELILCKFKCFSKFRGMITIIINFGVVAEFSTYIYKDVEVVTYGAYAIFVFSYIFWAGQTIVYNWIIFGIAYTLGYALFTTIFFLRSDVLQFSDLFFILALGVFQVYISREAEIKKRGKYFMLYTVQKREEELENLISRLPLGIAILEEEQEKEFRRLSSFQTEVKYSNQALKNILNEGMPMGNSISGSLHSETEINIEIEQSEGYIQEENRYVNDLISQIYSSKNIITEINGKNEITYEMISGVRKEFKLNKIEMEFQNKKSLGIIIEDLTLIKKIERDKLSQEFEKRLVRTISHEIRTPLNSIQGNIEIIENSLDPQIINKYKVYFRAMKNGVKYLLYFVDGIFKLSNRESQIFEYKRFKTEEMVKDIIRLFEGEVEGKEINIIEERGNNTPREIIQDQNAITQLIYILTANSVKYTYTGYIQIGISYEESEEQLFICVKDDGIGIPISEQEHLFQLYGKSENSEFGIGVGLTLCKTLVDGMGGNIRLESEVNMGTRVYINLPCKLPENQSPNIMSTERAPAEEGNISSISNYYKREAYPSISSISTYNQLGHISILPELPSLPTIITPTPTLSHHSPKILIVDDIQSNIFILKGLLGLLGLRADQAQNGLLAIEKIEAVENIVCSAENIQSVPYTVIFMDCNMPVMDGYDATRNIRLLIQQGKIHKSLIIGVTAYNSSENTSLCYEAGMDYVMFKPVSKQGLIELFQKYSLFQDIIT